MCTLADQPGIASLELLHLLQGKMIDEIGPIRNALQNDEAIKKYLEWWACEDKDKSTQLYEEYLEILRSAQPRRKRKSKQ